MRKLRILIVLLINKFEVSQKISIAIYWFTAKLVILLLKWRFSSLDVWVRNSLALGDAVPGLSDIDFTILNKASSKDVELALLQDLVKWLRVFIPIVGEFNYYDSNTVLLACELANPHELKRDNILVQKTNYQQRMASKAEDLVYVMRIYKSDEKNLQLNPMLRLKKWQRVFSSINQVDKFKDITSIESYINLNIKTETHENELIVHPHLWVENNWKDIDSIDIKKIFENKNDYLLNITISQISWEIFGILGQLPFLNNTYEMQYHFTHLKTIADNIPLAESKDLSTKLEQAILIARSF